MRDVVRCRVDSGDDSVRRREPDGAVGCGDARGFAGPTSIDAVTALVRGSSRQSRPSLGVVTQTASPVVAMPVARPSDRDRTNYAVRSRIDVHDVLAGGLGDPDAVRPDRDRLRLAHSANDCDRPACSRIEPCHGVVLRADPEGAEAVCERQSSGRVRLRPKWSRRVPTIRGLFV